MACHRMPLGMRYPLACGFMGLLQTDTKKRPLSGRFERENALSRRLANKYLSLPDEVLRALRVVRGYSHAAKQ